MMPKDELFLPGNEEELKRLVDAYARMKLEAAEKSRGMYEQILNEVINSRTKRRIWKRIAARIRRVIR